MKNNKGITLIALVITIILMLILASITINFAIVNGGIVKRAEQAKKIYEQAGKNEQEAIGNIWAELKREPEETLQPSKDTKEPTATITISGNTIQESLPIQLSATVKQEDEGSGIKIDSCKYVINTKSSEIGVEEENYTSGTFSNEDEIIPLELNTAEDWYLHVLTVDNSGNAKETIEGPIKVMEKIHQHSGSSTSGGGCYTKVVYHTHSDACRVNVYCDDGPYEGTTNGQYREFFYGRCSNCHNQVSRNWSKGYNYCNSCTICGKTEQTIQGYALNCGKTDQSNEGYQVIL